MGGLLTERLHARELGSEQKVEDRSLLVRHRSRRS
jgi:hypothetical protein